MDLIDEESSFRLRFHDAKERASPVIMTSIQSEKNTSKTPGQTSLTNFSNDFNIKEYLSYKYKCAKTLLSRIIDR